MTSPIAMLRTAPAQPLDMKAARRAAQDFEGQALGALLQPMFEGLSARGPFGGGSAEEMWRPMLVSEFGKAMAASGGIGIADAVLRQMVMQQEGPR